MQLKFSALLRQRHTLDKQAAVFLSKMLEDYPFCQPAMMLYMKSIMQDDKKLFEKELKKTLVSVPDKQVFLNYLNNNINEDSEKDFRLAAKEVQTETLSTYQGSTAKHDLLVKDDTKTADRAVKINYQQKIIDRFLESDPRIEVNRHGGPEGDLSRSSIEDKPDLASETLAGILLKQGKKERAILIYKKLILMFPEKSSYFAKKLEDIELDNI